MWPVSKKEFWSRESGKVPPPPFFVKLRKMYRTENEDIVMYNLKMPFMKFKFKPFCNFDLTFLASTLKLRIWRIFRDKKVKFNGSTVLTPYHCLYDTYMYTLFTDAIVSNFERYTYNLFTDAIISNFVRYTYFLHTLLDK